MTTTVDPSAIAPAAPRSPLARLRAGRGVRTPIVIQMESVECGAAALGIMLAHHGKHVPLEELRESCGVSRDGSSAASVLKAGRNYGMTCKGFQMDLAALSGLALPAVIFWQFNHFMVLERVGPRSVVVNDPAVGRRTVRWPEFDAGFTGIVLTMEPGPDFEPTGQRYSVLRALADRRTGLGSTVPLILLLALFLAAVGVVTPVFSRIFVDRVLSAGADAPSAAAAVLLAMSAAAVIVLAASWTQQWVLVRTETAVALGTASRFLRHLLRLPTTFFSQRQSSDVARRVGTNDQVAEILTRNLAATVVDGVLVLAYGALLSYYDPLLGLVAMAFATGNVLVLRAAARMRTAAVASLGAQRAGLFATTYNSIQLIETIKAAGDEDRYFSRLASQQAGVLSAQQRLGVPTAVLAVVPALLAALNTTLLLAVGSERVAEGSLTVGVLVAVQTLVASMNRPVGDLTALGGRLQDMSADLSRLRDVERYPVPPEGTPRPSAPVQGHLRITDLVFGHNPLSPPLIDGFALDVPPGGRVALVGGSGSGKSTIGRLVVGLHRPASGRITLDGAPIGEYDRDLWSTAVALVDQELSFFPGTVRDNITLWDPSVRDEDVVAALKDACLYDEVAGRPGALGSSVAEGARNFSGGQRQRLEIARALVRNPALVVLDEATSALDAETELKIDRNLRRRGATCLIVAHRLSTVRDCDLIVVLDAGAEVERGTHDELLARGGRYAELIRQT